ncbi:MAG: hypothetical protein LH474_06560 [Chamaesiphon sp.]|nr:hypothetical protein [Chamaesiphon sp.]
MKKRIFTLAIFGLFGANPSLATNLPPTTPTAPITEDGSVRPSVDTPVPAIAAPSKVAIPLLKADDLVKPSVDITTATSAGKAQIESVGGKLSRITQDIPVVGTLANTTIANVVKDTQTKFAGAMDTINAKITAGVSAYLQGSGLLDSANKIISGLNKTLGGLFGNGDGAKQAQTNATNQSAANVDRGIAVAGAAAQSSNGNLAAMTDAIARVDTSGNTIAQSAEFVSGTRAIASNVQSNGSNAQSAEFIANGTKIIANAGVSPQAQIQAAREKAAAASNAANAAAIAGTQQDNSLDELGDIKQLLSKQMETQAIQTNKLADLTTLTAAGLNQNAENARQQAIAQQTTDLNNERLLDRRLQGKATIIGLTGLSAPRKPTSKTTPP